MNVEDARSYTNFLDSAVEQGTFSTDLAMLIILVVSAVFMAGITFAMFYFVVVFRRSKRNKVKNITHNSFLEVTWTVVPTIIVLGLFVVGWLSFTGTRADDDMSCADSDVECVDVHAFMYGWRFYYRDANNDLLRDGKPTNYLVVPEGRKILAELDSVEEPPTQPVLHSFWIPALRVKEDTVPRGDKATGNYTTFVASILEEDKGEDARGASIYLIECTEYCGVGHSDMNTAMCVVPPDVYDEWLQGDVDPNEPGKISYAPFPARCGSGRTLDPVALGQIAFTGNCASCHSVDGSAGTGPTMKGIMGREAVSTEGEKVDEIGPEYIYESIREPNVFLHKDYPNGGMNAYSAGSLPDDDIENMIQYFYTLED